MAQPGESLDADRPRCDGRAMSRSLLACAATLLLVGCQETDPVFSNSPAGTATAADMERWNAAHAWGDHAAAGYVSSEADPLFVASAASTVTQADVDSWRESASHGDHAAAGYLTTEADPLFAASSAASIQAADVNSWNGAVAWGDHTLFGYATESDLVWTQGVGEATARPGGATPQNAVVHVAGVQLIGGNPITHIWQSFRALANTRLVRLEAYPGSGSNVTSVSIREGQGYAGTVLYTAPISDPTSVDLALPSIEVSEAQTYSVVFSRDTAGPLSMTMSAQNPYSRGVAGRDDTAMTDYDLGVTLTGTSAVVITSEAQVGINTTAPSALLDIAGDTVRIRAPKTPGSATAACLRGEVSWDANHVYVCVDQNTWRRAALSAW